MAEQPRSPLGGLDLDTAIRLRWALRDIKAKRKLSPDKFLKPSPHKRRKSRHAGRSESGHGPRQCVSILGQTTADRRYGRRHRPDAALIRLEAPVGGCRELKNPAARSGLYPHWQPSR